MAQWAYYSLADVRHENSKALELLLHMVLRQVAMSLLVRCLDRLWVALGQATWSVRGSGLQPLQWARLRRVDLEAVTTVLQPPPPLSASASQGLTLPP